MIPEEKDIELSIKNRIKDLEIAPPPGVWASIEHKLEEEKHRSGILLMFKMAASFALLTVVGISSFWLYRHERVAPQIAQNSSFHKVKHTAENYQIRKDENIPERNKNTVKKITVSAALQKGKFQTGIKHNTPPQKNNAPHPDATNGQLAINTPKSAISGQTQNLLISGRDNPSTFQVNKAAPVASTNTINDSVPVPENQQQLMALARINCQVLNSGNQKPVALNGQSSVKAETGQAHINIKDPFNLNSGDAGAVFSNNTSTSEGKWSVGGCYSPNYSFRTISGESSGEYSEKGLMAFSGGMKVKYASKSRWSFQSGVYYSKKGQVINDVSAVSYSTGQTKMLQAGYQQTVAYYFNNSTGKITSSSSNNSTKIIGSNFSELACSNSGVFKQSSLVSNSASSVSLVQSFDFIELPFVMNYKIIDRKTDVHLIGGISTNILVDNKIYDKSDAQKNKLGSTEDVCTFNCSSVMGIGMDYPLSKKMTISFDPTFNYNLNSFNKNSGLNSHPYSFYFMTGINYNF